MWNLEAFCNNLKLVGVNNWQPICNGIFIVLMCCAQRGFELYGFQFKMIFRYKSHWVGYEVIFCQYSTVQSFFSYLGISYLNVDLITSIQYFALLHQICRTILSTSWYLMEKISHKKFFKLLLACLLFTEKHFTLHLSLCK